MCVEVLTTLTLASMTSPMLLEPCELFNTRLQPSADPTPVRFLCPDSLRAKLTSQTRYEDTTQTDSSDDLYLGIGTDSVDLLLWR